MQAVRFHHTGGPDVLSVERVPVPEPGPGEVRLQLRAASVNYLDIWLRCGALPVPLPHIPGCDGAGMADALGDGVTGVVPGNPYLIAPGLSCGACTACDAGDTFLCPEFSVYGTGSAGTGAAGTYADYAIVPEQNLIPVPDGVDMHAAATLGVAGLTAWHQLVTRGRVRAGEVVLVHGAGSGLGSFAIQIARMHGARVLATAGSKKKCEQALALGADAVFDHTQGEFAAQVLAATGGKGVDVLFDHVGAALFAANLSCLAVGGKLLVCGTTTGAEAAFNLRDLFARQQSILGGKLGSPYELAELARHVAAGKISPVIDRVLPLSDAAAAHATMEERAHFGKIVLEMV